MPEFLRLLPPGKALDIWLAEIPPFLPGIEQIPVELSLGRILGAEIFSPESLPAFNRSTVDGYAVHASDTFGASDSLPAYLNLVDEIPMGQPAEAELPVYGAAPIHTGGMLPPGADAVVMLEYAQPTSTRDLEIYRPVANQENILKIGEDIRQGDLVAPRGRRIRSQEMGGFSALGIQSVPCFKQPRVGILSSGDEVIPVSKSPHPGQVRDVNSFSLSGLVEKQGAIPVRHGILPDNEQKFSDVLREVLEKSDFVIVSAGSSASTRDLTARTIQTLGKPGVLVHGVNIKPGKPTILAVCNGKPVLGLPGNPVSALIVAMVFARPVIHQISGCNDLSIPPSIRAKLTINLASQAGREDWIPVKLTPAAGEWQAEPIFFKSNLIFSLVQADGLICIPSESNGLPAGEVVTVFLLQGLI